MEPYENPEQNGKKTLWIIGGIILVIMLVGIVYGATQRNLKKTDTPDGAVPVNQTPAQQVLSRETAEQTPATIDTMTLANLGTFPYRVQAKITGEMSDGCSQPDVVFTQSGKTFTADVVGLKEIDTMCTMVMTPFETVVDVPVSGLTAGTYMVKLGNLSKTFTLVAENKIQFIGDK